MALFSRLSRLSQRERPPAAVTAVLEPEERVVAWADTADGTTVAATTLGLWWPFDDGPRRIGWQFVDKAIWRDGALLVIEADVRDDALLVERPAVRVELTVPRDLPDTVRRRVEGNVVSSELLAVGGGAVRFVQRRRPGADGTVWWARLEPGTPSTLSTRSAVAARLAILRADEAARPD